MGEARVLNNMSDVYLQLGDCEKALQVLLEVLEINERYDEALGVAIACFNIADTYSRMNQTALAREYFQRYLDVSGRIHNELGEGYGRLGLGLLHAREGNPAAAEREFREAAEVFGRLGSMSMNAEARMRTAQALVDLGRMDEAAGLVEGLDEESLGARETGFLRFVRGLLLLNGTSAGQADPGGAAGLITESVANTDPISEHDIATRFLALAGALELAGRPDEASRALSDGRAALEKKLAHIVSPVVRDSVRAIQSIRTLLTR
jgi:tetratricopeptide (TPR) repeat protein